MTSLKIGWIQTTLKTGKTEIKLKKIIRARMFNSQYGTYIQLYYHIRREPFNCNIDEYFTHHVFTLIMGKRTKVQRTQWGLKGAIYMKIEDNDIDKTIQDIRDRLLRYTTLYHDMTNKYKNFEKVTYQIDETTFSAENLQKAMVAEML